MNTIFKLTYQFLKYLEEITGFTYNEINIIIWFYLVPFFWLVLIDTIYKTHRFKIIGGGVMLLSLLVISDFENFSNWLFKTSVDFLLLFDTLGSNYTISSVIICLFIPVVITFILIKKAFFIKK